MSLTSTIWVVKWPDRDRWTVEGGHGKTVVLGVVSEHETKVEAIREAHRVAREHGVEVEIVGEVDTSLVRHPTDG